MKKRKDLNQECDYFTASMIDNIAWIELKGNMLQQPTFQSIDWSISSPQTALKAEMQTKDAKK